MKKQFMTFIKLPFEEKLIAAEVLFYSGVYRWTLWHKPFHAVLENLNAKKIELSSIRSSELIEFSPDQEEMIKSVTKILNSVCGHTIWKSECLVRAITAKKILNKRGIENIVFLGVTHDSMGIMRAHAWTKCGHYFVTGKRGHEKFTVTACFQ